MNIGQTILHYRVEELIGEGGMGTVYRGRDMNLDRSVALKVIYRHLLKDPTTLERFRNEAVILAQLSHPNVAGLYNFQPNEGVWVMVMEYVDGQTFEQLLKKEGPQSPQRALSLMRQVLAGLQHAHSLHVLHRDLKPANLMITRDGRVKLMDFGIARKAGAQRLTRTNHLIGTLDYMAPELISGQEPSAQSELYSLGIVLYELLTGHLPFTATTEPALISAIMRQKPTPPRQFCADLPSSICDLLADLLHKKPDHRPVDVAALDARISTILGTLPITTKSTKPVVKPTPATRIMTLSGTDWAAVPTRFLRSLGTFEGGILLGSLVLVGLVLYILRLVPWSDPEPSILPKKPAVQEIGFVEKQPGSLTALSASDPIALGNTPQTVTKQPVIRPISSGPVIINPAPERTSPPPSTVRNVPTSPERTRRGHVSEPSEKERSEATAPDETPASPPAAAPSSVRTVAVRGREVLLELLEDVSPQGAALGSTVRLRVVRTVTVDGLAVVEAGAPATATVTDRKWSEGGRTFLEITLQQVKAVNGTWIQIKYPPISESGSSSNPVEFPRGTRIEARLRDSSLTLAL